MQQSQSCRQRQLAPSLLSAPCEYTQRNGRRSCSSKLLTRGRRRKTRSTSASCVCRKEPAVLPSPSRASFGRRQKAPRCPRLLALFPVCPVANALPSRGRRRKTRDAQRGTSGCPCKVQPPALPAPELAASRSRALCAKNGGLRGLTPAVGQSLAAVGFQLSGRMGLVFVFWNRRSRRARSVVFQSTRGSLYWRLGLYSQL